MNMNISGLSIIKEQKRYYPLGEISAQIIGINDLDGKGIEGSELMYDHFLRGTKKYIILLKIMQVKLFLALDLNLKILERMYNLQLIKEFRLLHLML